MSMQALFIGMALLLSLAAGRPEGRRGADGPPAATAADTAAAIQAALGVLRSEGGSERLEIVHLPNEVLTRVRVSPAALESSCYFRIEFRMFPVSRLRDDLVAALEVSKLQGTTGEGDLRWGCIFYDEKDARVLTMYFDGHGAYGYINGVPVTGGERVVQVLEQRCSCLWAGQYRG